MVPASLVRADESEHEPVNLVEDRADTASRAEVEAKAMQAVMDRERELGFEPVDISSENRGYDIESRDPANGRLRFIEVKGRRADARTVSITRNEMLAAFNAADAFILAVVLVEGEFVHHPSLSAEPGTNLRSRTRFQRGVSGDFRGSDQARGQRQMTWRVGSGVAVSGVLIGSGRSR